MKRALGLLLWLVLGESVCLAQTYQLDGSNSLVEVHLGTAGALGFMGHDHLIQARIQEGSVLLLATNPSLSKVEVQVDSKALRVQDPELSPRDRQKVQTKMESDRILESDKFPTITFKSTAVNFEPNQQLVIFGNLTVRGQTRPIMLQARVEQILPRLRVVGSTQFKQSDFGIKPVSSGMGAVKVKDLMRITFMACGDLVRQPGK